MKELFSTAEVISRLRSEGFILSQGYIQFCFREGHVERPEAIGRALAWQEKDIQALREALLAHGRFGAEAQ